MNFDGGRRSCGARACYCTGACFRPTIPDDFLGEDCILGPRENDLPIVPPIPKDYNPLNPNPPIAKCGECGLILHKIMHYSCSNPRCPCFSRTICCSGW